MMTSRDTLMLVNRKMVETGLLYNELKQISKYIFPLFKSMNKVATNIEHDSNLKYEEFYPLILCTVNKLLFVCDKYSQGSQQSHHHNSHPKTVLKYL